LTTSTRGSGLSRIHSSIETTCISTEAVCLPTLAATRLAFAKFPIVSSCR